MNLLLNLVNKFIIDIYIKSVNNMKKNTLKKENNIQQSKNTAKRTKKSSKKNKTVNYQLAKNSKRLLTKKHIYGSGNNKTNKLSNAIIFLNTIRNGSVSTIKDFLITKKNAHTLKVTDIKEVLKSNTFYNIYPTDTSYYTKVIEKAKTHNPSIESKPTQSIEEKETTSNEKSNTQKNMSFAEFKKALKEGKQEALQHLGENNRNSITAQTQTLDETINKLLKYVQITIYIKYKFILYLQEEYSSLKRFKNSTSSNNDPIMAKLRTLSSKYSRSNQYFNSKYKKDIDEIMKNVITTYKKTYDCTINYSNMHSISSISSNIEEYNINTIFEFKDINLVVKAINTLFDEKSLL
jgi:hypothetical protein